MSTVTPGKFPTFWRRPVSILKTELLPVFGLPNNAILMVAIQVFQRRQAVLHLCEATRHSLLRRLQSVPQKVRGRVPADFPDDQTHFHQLYTQIGRFNVAHCDQETI
jgi:hypothetical protein